MANWYTPQWKWLASILLNNKGNIVFNTENKGCHKWKWSSEISALLNEISLKDESKRDNYCSNSPSMNNLQNKHCWPVHVAIALQLPLFLPKDCGFAWSFQQLSLVSLGFFAIITLKVVLIAQWPWLITLSTFHCSSTSWIRWARIWFCSGKSWSLHGWIIKHHNSLSFLWLRKPHSMMAVIPYQELGPLLIIFHIKTKKKFKIPLFQKIFVSLLHHRCIII